MNHRAKELIGAILKASDAPLSEAQMLNELEDAGYRSVTRPALGQHLDLLERLSHIRKERMPGRSGFGWILTESRKQQLGLLKPESPEPSANAQISAQNESSLPFCNKLWNWQVRALSKWEKAGRKGIVEAVTGSGKTMLGLAACDQLWSKPPKVLSLVVVPTVVLMEQWLERFERELPHLKVGLVGDGHDDDFRLRSVCIATVHSALPRLDSLFAHRKRMGAKTLLIADECHRYIGPPVFGKLLEFPFDYTLGLSATVESAFFESGLIQFSVRGLGCVIEQYTFGMAVKDGHIPAFTMLNTSCRLTPGERQDYDEYCQLIRDQMSLVMRYYEDELRYLDPGQNRFWRILKSLQKRGGIDCPVITRLFGLIFKRAAISYKAESKMRLAKEIVLLMLNEGNKKLIVFFERIQSAQDLEGEVKDGDASEMPNDARLDVATANQLCNDILQSGRNWCRVIHSGLDREDRKSMLQEFRNAKVAAMLACRVLDEGFDVPEIDVAILVASTKSSRQRIQRIGRALRKGDGRKKPLVVTLYVPETGDAEVVVNDKELFGDAATIFEEGASTSLEKLRGMLAQQKT